MTDPIRLTLLHDYPALPAEDFLGCRVIGIGPGQAVAYYEYGARDGHCVMAHLHGGVAERHELSVSPERLQDGPYAGSKASPVIMKANGQLLLLVNPRLVYVVDPTLRVIDEIAIENELPHVPELSSSPTKGLHPLPAAGFTDTNVVPLFIPGNRILAPGATRYMALLQVDTGTRSARWLDRGGETLFAFDAADFPPARAGERSPYVHHAIWKHNRLHVYAIGGSSGYVKWGMDYFGIAVYDDRRRLIDQPYLEQPAPHDPKKRGRMGDFCSSLQYCIVTPCYPTSDPWKRSQRLLDLEEARMREVVSPRGFAKRRVVEHAHDTFWLASTEPRGRFRLAACGQYLEP